MRIPIPGNIELEVNGGERPLTYVPALATLSPDQIDAAIKAVRNEKIMVDNVNVWGPNHKRLSSFLDTVSSDLWRAK